MHPDEFAKFAPTTEAEKIAKKLVQLASTRGSVLAARELADRVEGRAALAEEDRSALALMSVEDKRALLRELFERLGEPDPIPVVALTEPTRSLPAPSAHGTTGSGALTPRSAGAEDQK